MFALRLVNSACDSFVSRIATRVFLYSVDVGEKGKEFSVGHLHRLFQQDATANGSAYDVSRDGKHFLFNAGTQDVSASLNLVVNWIPEVRR